MDMNSKSTFFELYFFYENSSALVFNASTSAATVKWSTRPYETMNLGPSLFREASTSVGESDTG